MVKVIEAGKNSKGIHSSSVLVYEYRDHLEVRVQAREKDARPSREVITIKRSEGNSTMLLIENMIKGHIVELLVLAAFKS